MYGSAPAESWAVHNSCAHSEHIAHLIHCSPFLLSLYRSRQNGHAGFGSSALGFGRFPTGRCFGFFVVLPTLPLSALVCDVALVSAALSIRLRFLAIFSLKGEDVIISLFCMFLFLSVFFFLIVQGLIFSNIWWSNFGVNTESAPELCLAVSGVLLVVKLLVAAADWHGPSLSVGADLKWSLRLTSCEETSTFSGLAVDTAFTVLAGPAFCSWPRALKVQRSHRYHSTAVLLLHSKRVNHLLLQRRVRGQTYEHRKAIFQRPGNSQLQSLPSNYDRRLRQTSRRHRM